MSALFTVNGISIQTPIGTFVAIGNTSSFVSGIFSGWVFCDGVARSNASGIYTNLANMGIGSNSGGNFTSPNLSSAIMSGDDSYTLNTLVGTKSNYMSLASAQLPSHTHSITIDTASHTHTYTDYIADNNGGSTYHTYDNFSNPTGSTPHSLTRARQTTSTNDAHAHAITVDAVNGATGSQFNAKNTAFHIQWIVKYA